MERAYIYGDSLLKATMPDGDMKYHFHLPEHLPRYIVADGIHLTMDGCRRLFDTLAGWVRQQL